jgi:hypothetical protein
MASGDYYRAKVRTGGISGSLQPLVDYFQKKKTEQEQHDYIYNLLGAYKMIQGKISGQQDKKVQPSQQPNALGTTAPNVDPSYFGGETGMAPLTPQDQPREDVAAPPPSVTDPNVLSMNKYNKVQQQVRDFILDYIIKQKSGMDTSKGSQLANVLQSQVEGMKPTLTRTQEDESERTIVRDQYGNIVEEIPGKPKQKLTGKDFKITEDGYYAYWDDTKKEFIKTDQKAKVTDNSLGWSKLNYEQTKDAEEKAKTEKNDQAKYNSIMGSPSVKTEELIAQGLLDEKNPVDKQSIKTHKGGKAYVVRDDKGDVKLIWTDEELENYANSQISTAPNKWSRTKKKEEKGKTDDSGFVKDKVYVDANGNKAKYLGDNKWEEIK